MFSDWNSISVASTKRQSNKENVKRVEHEKDKIHAILSCTVFNPLSTYWLSSYARHDVTSIEMTICFVCQRKRRPCRQQPIAPFFTIHWFPFVVQRLSSITPSVSLLLLDWLLFIRVFNNGREWGKILRFFARIDFVDLLREMLIVTGAASAVRSKPCCWTRWHNRLMTGRWIEFPCHLQTINTIYRHAVLFQGLFRWQKTSVRNNKKRAAT